MPHAYRELIESEMARKGWTQARLADESGNSRQLVNSLLKDERGRLAAPPKARTVAGYARAFGIPEPVIWSAVAKALGLPIEAIPTVVHQVQDASNEELLGELARRLQGSVADRSSATVTELPQRIPVWDVLVSEDEATAGEERTYPGAEEKRAAHQGGDEGETRNRSTTHGGAVKGFDPGPDAD